MNEGGKVLKELDDDTFKLPDTLGIDEGMSLVLVKGKDLSDCIARFRLYPTEHAVLPFAYLLIGSAAEKYSDRRELAEFFYEFSTPAGIRMAINQRRELTLSDLHAGVRMTKFCKWMEVSLERRYFKPGTIERNPPENIR